jgi:Zn-dependent peptidase ImmA (M78 family)/transcriptional regulator with XRE-family HTH domain
MQVSGGRFNGERLRLARLVNGFSLDDLGKRVSVSRQFAHQLETNAKEPTSGLMLALAAALSVTPDFFRIPVSNPVQEEHCHFRRLFTTPKQLMQQAAAKGTLIDSLVAILDRRLRLPEVRFPSLLMQSGALQEVENIAEHCRLHWGLGLDAPIKNMTRVVETAGAVVVHFDDISERIDALSIARRRPIIVRSSAKASACRLRFDLAHECGHLVMHQGLLTGDHETEDQANRFASAFLLPRKAFIREFPHGRRLDWVAIWQMKKRWKVAARAIARRAFDLGLIDAAQYRTANIHLVKSGQAKQEKLDDVLKLEESELLTAALSKLNERSETAISSLASELGITSLLLGRLTGFRNAEPTESVPSSNVVRLQST